MIFADSTTVHYLTTAEDIVRSITFSAIGIVAISIFLVNVIRRRALVFVRATDDHGNKSIIGFTICWRVCPRTSYWREGNKKEGVHRGWDSKYDLHVYGIFSDRVIHAKKLSIGANRWNISGRQAVTPTKLVLSSDPNNQWHKKDRAAD